MATGTGGTYLCLFQHQFYSCPAERTSLSGLSALLSFYSSVTNEFSNGRARESNIVYSLRLTVEISLAAVKGTRKFTRVGPVDNYITNRNYRIRLIENCKKNFRYCMTRYAKYDRYFYLFVQILYRNEFDS